MNDRYNTLKLESSALWRTVLEDGSDHFRKKAQKAIEAARNTVRSFVGYDDVMIPSGSPD